MAEDSWLRGRAATLLINPNARGVPATYHGGPIHRFLEAHGIAVDVQVPSTRDETVAAARAAVESGAAAVFAVGGDGTLRDAAEGLAGSETALAAVPGGTVNIWCREAGIPMSARAAVTAHLGGQRLRFDLGRAGEHHFLLMATGGWDAEIVRTVSPALKGRLGDYAYIVQGARLLPSLRATPMRLRMGITVEERPAAIFVLSNTRLYGGRVRFNPGATVTDGALDLAVVSPRSPKDVVRVAAKTIRGRLAGDADVQFFTLSEMVVETEGIPIQADGDYIGDSPMTFCVDPGALLVSVPAGELTPIFRPPD